MISFYQGTTKTIELEVLDADGTPANLTGFQIVFAYEKKGSEEIVKNCTIEGGLIYVTLSAAETTSMIGNYDFEFKSKDPLGRIETLKAEFLTVKKSIIPVFPV